MLKKYFRDQRPGETCCGCQGSLRFLARNDDDEDEEEACTEERRILRRIVGKSQFMTPRRPDIAFATNRLARSLAKRSKSDIIASKRLLRHLCGAVDFGLKLQVQNTGCTTLTVVHRKRFHSSHE